MGYSHDGQIVEPASRLEPPEGDANWCEKCLKPSLLMGLVWALKSPKQSPSDGGVELWGTVKGCRDCRTWEWRNVNGVLCKVIRYKSIEQTVEPLTEEQKAKILKEDK